MTASATLAGRKCRGAAISCRDTGVNETLSFDRVYFAHWYRRAAGYVDRVLEEKLAGLPVLAPTSDQAAKVLGLEELPAQLARRRGDRTKLNLLQRGDSQKTSSRYGVPLRHDDKIGILFFFYFRIIYRFSQRGAIVEPPGKVLFHALILLVIAISLSGSGFAQSIVGSSAAPLSDGLPAWAFLWDPTVKVPPPNDRPNPLPGSNAAFSWRQARDLFFAPDWHPDGHPAMPEIVSSGRKPDVRACGSCHRVEGTGGPENANLAGLPVSYFVQQVADFKSGARKMSGPERPSTQLMTSSVKGLTDSEIIAAAEYFAALKPKRIIKVVESETIPKTGPSRLVPCEESGGRHRTTRAAHRRDAGR